MEFASEMVVRSALAGLRIEEVPTTLKPDGRSRAPHLRTWRDGWRHLKFLLMYNPRWLFFIPGAALACLGTILAGLSFFGSPPPGDSHMLDLNSYVAGCFMVMVGALLLTFGVLSRRYADVTGMLPSNQRADWLVRHINTDRLALDAGILFLGGVMFFIGAIVTSAGVGLGPLADPLTARVAVLGLTLIAIAFQIFFCAFLLGVLDMPLKRLRAITEDGRGVSHDRT
jgi:hypothetical protein